MTQDKLNIFELDVYKLTEIDWFDLEFLHNYNYFSVFFNTRAPYFPDDDNSKRLRAYYVKTWYCTDTYVGICLYTLDSEPIFFTTQSGRKSSIYPNFKDKESVEKLYKYLESLPTHKNEIDEDLLCEKNYNFIEPTYKIDYVSQYLPKFHKNCYYNNEKVEVLQADRNTENVKIKFIDTGKSKVVSVKDLSFTITD